MNEVADALPSEQRRAMIIAQEKGASAIVTTLPLKKHGFSLAKNEFRDHLLMRYQWPLSDLPTTCACGRPFSLDHSQSCHVGGFINMRHDELRNLLASEMKCVLRDVEIEPRLQPLTGEDLHPRSAIITDDARADIRARSFWTNQQNAYFDIRVFYPHASSYLSRSLPSLCVAFEKTKKNQYNDRVIEVERGSFTPLVFSSCGGMGIEASMALKKLAVDLAEKKKQEYSAVIGLLRCRIAFALMRAASVCLRGTRAYRGSFRNGLPVDLVVSEAHIDC
jgi:hypothetical protein